MPRIVAESSPEAKNRVSPASRAMVASRAVRSLAGSIALTWVIVVRIYLFYMAEKKILRRTRNPEIFFLPRKISGITRLVALAL